MKFGNIHDSVMDFLHQVKTLDGRPIELVPASEEDVEAFEKIHRLKLPEELKNWFRHCNGAPVSPGGLYGLFTKGKADSVDWHFLEYPHWIDKGWIPIAGDGSGDIYVMTTQLLIPSTQTHPICFVDQSDFEKPQYATASSLWKFLFFLLEAEILKREGKEVYWPFNKRLVLAKDPFLAECRVVPLPWEPEDK